MCVAVLASCGGSSPSGSATTTVAGVPATDAAGTTTLAGTTASTAPPGTDGPGGESSTTTTTTSEVPPAPVAPHPPAPGTYSYDTDGTYTYGGASHRVAAVTTLVVEAVADGSQRFVRTVDDVDGNGVTATSVLLYQPDAILLASLEVRTRYGLTEDVQRLDAPQPVPIVTSAVKVGDHFEYDLDAAGTHAHVVADVVEFATRTVGGQSIAAYRVDTTTTFDGTIQGTATASGWIAPEIGLIIEEHVDGDVVYGIVRTRAHYDAMLRSLQPT